MVGARRSRSALEATSCDLVAVIPTVPHGAIVQSMLTALIRTAPAISLRQAPQRYFGIRTLPNDMYTVHAANLSRLGFAGRLSANLIRRHHGVLPLAMAFREQEQETQLWQRIEQGDRSAYRSLSGGWSSVLTTRVFRHCVECVLEQQVVYGVGHWMAIHQIAGVGRCSVHDAPLVDRCADCGSAVGGPEIATLPSDPCFNCGGTRRAQTLRARLRSQRSYVSLASAALDGNAGHVRPEIRKQLLSEVRTLLGSSESLASGVLDAWGASSISELAAHLECDIPPKSFSAAYDGHLHGLARPFILAIVAYCQDIISSDENASRALSERLGQLRSLELLPEQQKLFDVLQGISPKGYPVAALKAFSQGRALAEVTRERLASRAASQKLLLDIGGAVAFAHSNLRLSPFPPSFGDNLKRAYFRRIALGAREGGVSRGQLSKKAWGVYLWLLRNDRDWLDEEYPCMDRKKAKSIQAVII